MHGQALGLRSSVGEGRPQLEAPMPWSYGDDQFGKPGWRDRLHALWLILARERVRAFTIMLVALMAGVASIWLTKPLYSARATIQIDSQSSPMLGTEGTAPSAESTGDDRALERQVDLLASRETAEHVANDLDLANDPLFLREVGLENQPRGPMRTEKLASALQDRLSVSSPRHTDILSIRFDSHDPVTAARIANTFAETFARDSLERQLFSDGFWRRLRRGQLEVAKVRLNEAERSLMNHATAPSAADLDAYLKAQANLVEADQRWQQALSRPQIGNSVSIIDRAEPPAKPAYPRPAMNLALAALVGALALGGEIARSRMNERSDEAGDVKLDFDAPPLTVVPPPPSPETADRRVSDKVNGSGDLERDFDGPLLGVVPMTGGGEDFPLAMLDPRGSAAEAHRAIFVALNEIVRKADHRVLLVTSSSRDEGKSTIAVRLAAAFAGAGKKVLMIDADMRRGSLHRMLGSSDRPGLTELLAPELTEELTKVARYCAVPRFWVVPRGEPATNPAKLLASRRLADLLDEAVELYDLVIMDGPPTFGLLDAPCLSGMADATVFVVHADRTPREHAKVAIRRLSDAGAGQIGLVISTCDSAQDFGVLDQAQSYNHAAGVAAKFVAQEPPRAEPAPAHLQSLHPNGWRSDGTS